MTCFLSKNWISYQKIQTHDSNEVFSAAVWVRCPRKIEHSSTPLQASTRLAHNADHNTAQLQAPCRTMDNGHRRGKYSRGGIKGPRQTGSGFVAVWWPQDSKRCASLFLSTQLEQCPHLIPQTINSPKIMSKIVFTAISSHLWLKQRRNDSWMKSFWAAQKVILWLRVCQLLYFFYGSLTVIPGPALCLYFAALRCTTNPPSVPLPRHTKQSEPMELSPTNCPPAFVSFLRVWSNTVPAIQNLAPEHRTRYRPRYSVQY